MKTLRQLIGVGVVCQGAWMLWMLPFHRRVVMYGWRAANPWFAWVLGILGVAAVVGGLLLAREWRTKTKA